MGASMITKTKTFLIGFFSGFLWGITVTMESSGGEWVHHVRLGLKLKEAMDKLGMECTVVSKDHQDDRYENTEDFLITQLKR